MNSVIVHYQEIALKGRNRPWFVERLVNNLRDATRDLDIQQVRPLMGRIELTLGSECEWSMVRERVSRVFGIANYAQAGRTTRDVDEIAAMVLGDETALLITTRGSDIRLEGDLNVDNSMDVFDILLLIDHILGYVDHINPYLADINGDGKVNIMDMIRLIQRVMEW